MEPERRPPSPAGLEARILRARLVLFWERLWRALWPASGLAASFVAASLFDLWSHLPGFLHSLLVLLWLGAVVAALGLSLWRLRLPRRAEAMRRLERDSCLSHRPLAALEDRMAAGAGDPEAETLWQAHRARLLARLKALRLARPKPALAGRDPFALRFLALLLLTASVLVAGRAWDARLAQAFNFRFGAAPGPQLRIDAWIDPPPYTSAAPQFLLEGAPPKGGPPQKVAALKGAKLVMRVYGLKRPPKLAFTPQDGRRADEIAFGPAQEGVFALDYPLTRDGTVSVRRGARQLARFTIALKADLPPVIALTEPIRATRQGALRIGYRVEDDFGVTAAMVRLRKAEDNAADAETVETPLSLPSRRLRGAKLQSYVDLTAHAWAGLPVSLELVARDEAGQEGLSAPVSLVLPERQFTDPLARALIEQRKILALSPARAREVARFLEAVTLAPERFTPSASLYLGLRAAYWRLTARSDKDAIPETIALLWQLALALEEGDRARAEDELARAREALMEALARDAPEEEIERLLSELKEALDRYIATLEAEALKALAEGRVPALLPPDARAVSRADFEKLLEAIGTLARTGARDQARELLSGLDHILRNLQANFGAAPLPGSPEAAAGEALQQLSDIIGGERALMDDTFRQGGAEPQSEEESAAKGRALGERQQGLRRRLGDVMAGLGEAGAPIPESFGRAERAMREAQEALGARQWSRALEAERQALEELRAGAEALAEQAFAGFGQAGQGAGRRGLGMPGTDPFGRPHAQGGADDGSSVKVPEAMELRRAREILEEIERRASEQNRPQDERDYLKRLLKRF